MSSTTQLSIALALATGLGAGAQNARSFSLDEAVSHALANNYELQQKQLDIDIAQAKVKETTAIGLPQVNGEASMNYYIDIPTQVAEPFDFNLGSNFNAWIAQISEANMINPPAPEPKDPDALQEFQFGLPYSATAGVTVSQLIFDGSYFVGLKAAKAYKENVALGKVKSEIEVRNNVTKAYFSVVAMNQTLEALKKDLETVTTTTEETRALYETGFAEKQDVDQVRLMRSNLNYQIDATERQRDQMLNLLKFQMGVPVDQEIELTSSMEELIEVSETATSLLNQQLSLQNHIDYRMVQQGLTLQELSLSNERAKYYPQLNAVFTHSQNGFSRKFGELFSNTYYPTTLVGLQLKVPIFSSGMRYHKNKQAKLEVEKLLSRKKQVEQSLAMEAATARDNYRSALERYTLLKDDLALAESIKETTMVKFREGLVTSQELNTAQSQYLQTLRNYINTTLELLNAKLALDKALGNQ